MPGSPSRTAVRLALSEPAGAEAHPAPWIGPLLALGTRVARYIGVNTKRQLIVAASVPSREFAAALIGCGWVMASEAPFVADPLETLRRLKPGTPLRAVNSRHVVSGYFSSLDESVRPARVKFADSTWRIDGIRALSVLDELDTPGRAPRPEVGSVGRMARLDHAWDARLAAPAADLAVIGTLSWLNADFDALLGREDDRLPPSPIRDLLLPNTGHVATWFTRIYSSARLADHLPLPSGLRAVVLDGAGAIKYLSEIDSPVVICILDRSVADETAAEIVVQLRNTRGEPITIQGDLGWRCPDGVEALAFTVAL